jgi:hypothetical protein
MILADNPLRETVNSGGPSDLEAMFEVGSNIIEEVATAAESLSKAAATPVRAPETSAIGHEPIAEVMASRGAKRRAMVRLALGRSAYNPARHPNEGIGVGGPIMAVEKAQRTSSIRQAKHRATSKSFLVQQERPSSVKKAKHDTRMSVRVAPVIAVEESRGKSRPGRG